MKERLRIGLLLDSFEVPAWTYLMLAKIKDSDYARIELVILDNRQKEKQSFWKRFSANRNKLCYIAYHKIEDILFKPKRDPFLIKDAHSLLADAAVIKVETNQSRYSDRFKEEDIKQIKGHEIDVLIRLGFKILRGEILNCARYGIWSFHHDDNRVIRGGPAGFWEVFENHPVTGSVLQILTEDLDSGRIIYRSSSTTDPLSVNRNRENYFWKTLLFIPRRLEQLHKLGEKEFWAQLNQKSEEMSSFSQRLYKEPRDADFIKMFLAQLNKWLRTKLYFSLFREQWCLMFSLKANPEKSFSDFKKIIPPKDRFWSDPHIIHKGGKYYIFIEELLYKTYKGKICLIVMDEQGNYSQPKTIIERPYHLSYPFVFEWRGEYYLIPESWANKTIEVYKCTRFPDQWQFYKNLMENIQAVDATLFSYQGKWWLFANVMEIDGVLPNDELCLFYADNPLSSQWAAHPANPIVSDTTRARPAGRLFMRNGRILRPAQDCSKTYGYGIRINQIVRLNEQEYEEKEVEAIEPDWEKDIKAVHIFNRENRLTMIDARIKRFRYF
jgi:hypothetical protein